MNLVRFGVSMEEELVDQLDALVEREGYANRSEALRSLVRKELVRGVESNETRQVAGIVTLLYRYGHRMAESPVDAYPSLQISANLQLHLEAQIVLKILVVQGAVDDVYGWARTVTTQRGVLGDLKVVANEDIYAVLGRDSGDHHGRKPDLEQRTDVEQRTGPEERTDEQEARRTEEDFSG